MQVTPTDLRRDLYRTLDRVLATGEPVEVMRNGRRLLIVAVDEPVASASDAGAGAGASKLARLPPRPDAIVGDPEELVHLDWSGEWRP